MVKKYFLLLFALLFSAGLYADEPASHKEQEKQPDTDILLEEAAYEPLLEFMTAMSVVKSHYVDGSKVTYEHLFEAALRGMLRELDPYSTFETEEMFRETQIETSGETAGIGITIVMQKNGLEVIDVHTDGPAARGGLKAGDIITEIDDKPLANKKMRDCTNLIRGDENTSVKIKFYRGSTDAVQTLQLIRKKIVLPTIRTAKMIDPDNAIAYIQLNQFSAKTSSELDAALKTLTVDGMKYLILDLRNNPGGVVRGAAETASRFLPPGKLVVSLEGRKKEHTQVYKTVKSFSLPDMPLVILINGSSASASEILAACLQDYQRAVLVGERSFGKGVVQTIIPFGKKEALRITTAKYFTPSHRQIHGNGIEPDIVVPLTNSQRYTINAQMNAFPGVIKPDDPHAIRDIQLERAVESLRTVKRFQDMKAEKL